MFVDPAINLTSTWSGQWNDLISLEPFACSPQWREIGRQPKHRPSRTFGGLSRDKNFDRGDTWTRVKQVICLPGDGSLHVRKIESRKFVVISFIRRESL